MRRRVIPPSGLGADYHIVHEEMRPARENKEQFMLLERNVIDAAIEFRKRRMDIQPDAVPKSIFDAGATFDVQLNDFIRAIDKLIEERSK